MKFGFEQLKKQYQEEQPKELGNFKVNEKGERLYRRPNEEPEIQTPDDFIDFLDEKVKDILQGKVPEKIRRFAENPEEFKEEFESKTVNESEDVIMDLIDTDMKELSHLHDVIMIAHDTTLDQRLDYKDISDKEMNNEIKRRLDDRIHLAQQYQRNVLDLIEYLESKKVECIINGKEKGIFDEGGVDEEKNENI